jgi:hypothetical protein
MSERLACPVSKGKPEDRDGPLVFWHSDLLGANLSIHARGVYADLAMRYNFKKRKAVFPSIRKMAATCKVSLTTVIRCIEELEKAGLIEANRVHGKASQYQLRSIKEWRQWKNSQKSQATVPLHGTHCSTTDISVFHQVEPILILDLNPSNYVSCESDDSQLTHTVTGFASTEKKRSRSKEHKNSQERSEEGNVPQLPEISEVKEYAGKLGLPESDAEYLHDNWLANGFTNNGQPIRNWQAVVRTRQARGFLPSQKQSYSTPKSKSCLYPK